MTKPPVGILGCGPAGLIAAHTVERCGGQPIIYSTKEKSVIPGSQYLHEPIPGLTSVYPEDVVQYVRMGTAAGYAEKVYGDAYRYTGWDNYRALYPSWNVIKAYDALWETYESDIVNWTVTKYDIEYMNGLHPILISTLPQQAICADKGHVFAGVPYWIKPLPLPEIDRGHDLVIYNGMPEDHWYRYSILGDRCSIETTNMAHVLLDVNEGWINGMKATHNTCDCWPGIHRVGRWAQWRHGVLLHNVYHDVKEIMNGTA